MTVTDHSAQDTIKVSSPAFSSTLLVQRRELPFERPDEYSSSMKSFEDRMGSAVSDTNTRGWLVAILELGAWFGVLCTGYLADKLSRKRTIVLGTVRPFIFELNSVAKDRSVQCGWCDACDGEWAC